MEWIRRVGVAGFLFFFITWCNFSSSHHSLLTSHISLRLIRPGADGARLRMRRSEM